MGVSSFDVLGELADEGIATLEGGNVAIVDIATFQEFTGIYGEVDRIDLIFTPPLSAGKLDRVKALLPAGVELTQPSEAKETGRVMIRAYQLNLSVLSFVSLFVGMFLVYSLISLHATSRRKELAILRSVGASARMLFFLFIAEGCFFGIAGWALAIPASLFMTKKLIAYVGSTVSHLFVRVNVEGFGLTGREIFFSFAITVLVAVMAACQPAFEASRVRAREALLMREAVSQEEGKPYQAACLFRVDSCGGRLAAYPSARFFRNPDPRIHGHFFPVSRLCTLFTAYPEGRRNTFARRSDKGTVLVRRHTLGPAI